MLGSGLNEIAVERELADERIDLAQLQRQLRTVLQVELVEAAHEEVANEDIEKTRIDAQENLKAVAEGIFGWSPGRRRE